MKTLYEVNWHYSNDLLVRISVTPIKVLREGILPGCSAVSITAVDSNGRGFQGCPENYFETEEAAWEQAKIELQDAIAEEEYIISEAQRRIKAIRNVLLTDFQHTEPDCNHCGGTGDVSGEYPGIACPDCAGTGKTPQTAKPLTDERIKIIWKETKARMGDGGDPVLWFARAIEYAHNIRVSNNE